MASESEIGVSPTSLSIEQLTRALNAVSEKPVTAEMIETDVAAGAPANPDGTVNLVHYTAWLVREMRTQK